MNLELFLQELTELSKKHGITIDACGCCDGIWATATDEKSKDGSYKASPDGVGVYWAVAQTK